MQFKESVRILFIISFFSKKLHFPIRNFNKCASIKKGCLAMTAFCGNTLNSIIFCDSFVA